MSDIFDLFKKISPKEPATPHAPPTHMLVGLGNPGDKYTLTRHNAGFLALGYISEKLNVKVNRLKFRALTGEAEIAGMRVMMLAPQTYMNLSGEAVRECADFYKIQPSNIIVISDDINLDVGRLRVRRSGSDGGQKGLRSIIEQLETEDFPRIRIGVGAPPHPEYEIPDWVLSEFTKEEQKIIFECMATVYAGVEKILLGDIDGAMQLCNSAKKP
jgi:PTH1 family peptidyl-tRNA hydrolase